MSAPKGTLDPRFKVARTLVMNSRAAEAVDIFAALLVQAVESHGEDSLETAPLYHEYGNALFRAYRNEVEREENEDEEDAENDKAAAVDPETKRSAVAEAAEKRLQTASQQQPPPVSSNTAAASAPAINETSSEASSSDLNLALEMLETAWAIYDAAIADEDDKIVPFRNFILEQMPRMFNHLGDVLLECKRYADAVDVQLQALKFHEDALQELLPTAESSAAAAEPTPSLELLKCLRKVTEDNVLIAETLLACPDDGALVTTETKTVLVPKGERISYAKGYYEAAQSCLQDTIFTLGQLAAKNVDLGEEKENVCFASTMLMGVGVSLNALDDLNASKSSEPSTKKAKM
ncbi:hypothetical protein MPSEU_000952800 [Mayamaea pseudoterrestris]|nr:hypothetical protein MPSEU_000952800 [Mayamaea pseudoterrestris]